MSDEQKPFDGLRLEGVKLDYQNRYEPQGGVTSQGSPYSVGSPSDFPVCHLHPEDKAQLNRIEQILKDVPYAKLCGEDSGQLDRIELKLCAIFELVIAKLEKP